MAMTVPTHVPTPGRFADVPADELADTIEQRWSRGEPADWGLVFGLLERVLQHEDRADT
jgi:hypothetical protein